MRAARARMRERAGARAHVFACASTCPPARVAFTGTRVRLGARSPCSRNVAEAGAVIGAHGLFRYAVCPSGVALEPSG
eukprot:3666283-Alexandrium_andersonii.AAC.1